MSVRDRAIKAAMVEVAKPINTPLVTAIKLTGNRLVNLKI